MVVLPYLQVVNVEGPSVAMEEPYIGRSINGGGLMEVGVELKGPNALPVTAYLTVAQRLLSPGVCALAPTDTLQTPSQSLITITVRCLFLLMPMWNDQQCPHRAGEQIVGSSSRLFYCVLSLQAQATSLVQTPFWSKLVLHCTCR